MCFLKALSDLRKLARGCQLFTGRQWLPKPLAHTSKGWPSRVGTGLLSHGCAWTSSHRELPGGTAKRGHQRPQVQQHTHPAGGHLDPEDGPA